MNTKYLLSFALLTLGALSSAHADDDCSSVTLGSDEASTLHDIMKRDDLLKGMAKAQLGADNLLKGLSWVSGPVSLALKWDQGTIKGWRSANKALEKIAKLQTCQDIALQLVDANETQCFWDNLNQARGCE